MAITKHFDSNKMIIIYSSISYNRADRKSGNQHDHPFHVREKKEEEKKNIFNFYTNTQTVRDCLLYRDLLHEKKKKKSIK